MTRHGPGAALAAAAVAALVLCTGGALVAAGSLATSTRVAEHAAATGQALRVEAIPEHARGLAVWVVRAGSRCRQVTPPLIAAQLDTESGWDPQATAHNPPQRGGDAMGIAQFQQATWDSWGGDADGDGVDSPYDPADAITAQGRLMCDLVDWARQQTAAGVLDGDPVDVALAGYFCGRGCVRRHQGVPTEGLAADYPVEVRARVRTYTATGEAGPVGDGWVFPLPAGSYTRTSGFGMRAGRRHTGVDYAAPTGTRIRAVADGTVLDAGCTSPRCDVPGSLDMPGCGYQVTLHHGGSTVTRYCHPTALAVAAGQQVRAGQTIAWVGSTGRSTGPHLHVELHRGAPPVTADTAVDPETVWG